MARLSFPGCCVHAAAAEAMRRILIDNARKKKSEKRGGQQQRVEWHDNFEAPPKPSDDLLAVDEARLALFRGKTAAGMAFRPEGQPRILPRRQKGEGPQGRA